MSRCNLFRNNCFSFLGMSVSTPVQVLLRLRCPTAITGFVIAVIVYPIQRFARWLVSHVGQEVSKVLPAVTDLYSSTTVSKPMSVIWIGAALKHSVPAAIDSRPAANTRIAMLETCLTPTTERVSASQVAGLDNGLIPAIANTVPASLFSAITCRTYDHEHSEPLVHEIDFIWHPSIVSQKYFWKRTA